MTLIDLKGMADWLTAKHYARNTQLKILRQLSRMQEFGMSEFDLNTMELGDIYEAIYNRPMTTPSMRKHLSLTVRRYQEYQEWREAA